MNEQSNPYIAAFQNMANNQAWLTARRVYVLFSSHERFIERVWPTLGDYEKQRCRETWPNEAWPNE